MKFKLILLLLLVFSCTQKTHAQSLAINTDGSTANASALLDVKSITKGMLIPRMTTIERNAIATPAAGLQVYDTDLKLLYFYNGTAWAALGTSTNYWSLSGGNLYNNTGTKLGIGNSSPSAKLHVGGGTRFTVLDTGSVFLQSGNTIGSARDWKMYVSLPNGYLSFRDMGFDNLNNGMATDAMVIQYMTGNVGIGTNNPSELTHVSGGNFLNSGTFGSSSSLTAAGAGTRMFFYPRKAAFRAGNVSGTQWDDANIGDYSMALGQNAQAKTSHSIAIGEGNIAETNPYSVAIGRQNHSAGFASLAMGHFSEAVGDYSAAIGLRDTINIQGFAATALGGYNKISAQYSFAAGFSNTIGTSGLNAFAVGANNTVNANAASVMGFSNVANGFASFATGTGNYTGNAYAVAMGELDSSKANNSFTMGSSNTVNGNFGAAIGVFNYAPSYAEMTVGHYATTYTALNNNGVNAADRVFTIGNGSNNVARSNAMVVLKSGNIGIGSSTPNSTLQVSGTLAVDVSMAVAGGTGIGSPVLLSTQKSYIGLSPTATNAHYQLPLAPTCPGRMYFIRNNDNSQNAFLVSVAGSLLCPGNTNCIVAGSTYTLAALTTGKTVICVSDGSNWTVMGQN